MEQVTIFQTRSPALYIYIFFEASQSCSCYFLAAVNLIRPPDLPYLEDLIWKVEARFTDHKVGRGHRRRACIVDYHSYARHSTLSLQPSTRHASLPPSKYAPTHAPDPQDNHPSRLMTRNQKPFLRLARTRYTNTSYPPPIIEKKGKYPLKSGLKTSTYACMYNF
jgi:hypothetical protein